MSPEKIEAIGSYEASPLFSDLERLVLTYADELTRTPVEVPDDVFERLRAHFSEAQLVELTSAIAWENFRARFNHAFGAESEGFNQGAYCRIPVASNT